MQDTATGRSRNLAGQRLAAAVRSGLDDRDAGPGRRAAAADRVDGWLSEVWADAVASVFGGEAPLGLVLVADGSHARRDSGPAGDLDLLLLHTDRFSAAQVAEFADRLWYPIWDSGFRLDHAVRSVSAARDVAGRDVAVAMAGLELRPIVGDADLALRTRHVLREDWRKKARTRVPELLAGVRERQARHGELKFVLEPDLKFAHGGLRDAACIDALVATWWTDAPHADWQQGRGFLLDVRDGLHAVTGRPTERLVLAEQDAVAAALGMDDADALLSEVCGAARSIDFALAQAVRNVERAFVARSGLRRLTAPRLRTIESGVSVHDGEVVTVPGHGDPTLGLRAAAAAARLRLPLSAVSAARIAELDTQLPNPWPTTAREAFFEVLSAGAGLPDLWETLDNAGLIVQWLPEWQGIRNRPQRNAVHQFTVDRHSVVAVSLALEAAGSVSRPDLLMLAALLHDIGKLPGEQDHSALGARIAAPLLARLGLSLGDQALVVRLVREHLTLVDLATRRDPDDPATVAALADAVDGSDDTLSMLRALTEADARAAGPAAWTSWRKRLVDDLVHRARVVLSGQPLPQPSPLNESELDLVSKVRADQDPRVSVAVTDEVFSVTVVAPDRTGLFADISGLLAAQGISVRSALIRTVDGIAVDTWFASSSRGIPDPGVLRTLLIRLADGDLSVLDRLHRRDAAYVAPAGVSTAPQVLLAPGASAEASVVEVRALDRPGLLHRLGTALRTAGVGIRSAHVATHAGRAVDTLYLAESDTGGALNPARTAEVIGLLTAAANS